MSLLRAAAAALVTVAIAAAGAGCGQTPDVPAASSPSSPGAIAAVDVAAPTAIRIPAIGATSSLVPVGLQPDGAIAVPDVRQPEQAAWYDGSPRPGALGPAVLLGHVNGGGRPGVFARLAQLQPGDQVLVDRGDASTATFVVDQVETVAKTQFPTQAVYGDTTRPELRVLTCGGDLDAAAHRYLGQVIVFAHLAT